MRYASIDAGTNTFRLLIAEPGEGGLRRLLVENRITRLGEALPKGGAVRVFGDTAITTFRLRAGRRATRPQSP